MTRSEFNAVFLSAVNKWRELAPKDTGHLAFNAIKGKWISETHFKIWVDRKVILEEPNPRGEIATYYYPSTINRVKQFKTYNWVEKTAYQVAQYIARKIGGEIR